MIVSSAQVSGANADFLGVLVTKFAAIPFVEECDQHFNPLGAKGIGEIGITRVAAAIANAVYHATGKRVRDLADCARQIAGMTRE